MLIEVLGPDCDKCYRALKVLEGVIREMDVDADLRAVTDMREILEYAVMVTPAIIIDGKEVLVGRPPTKKEAKKWIRERMGED
jgi:small redox-active disulfide protein 2